MIVLTNRIGAFTIEGWSGPFEQIALDDRGQQVESFLKNFRQEARAHPVGVFAELDGQILSILSPQAWRNADKRLECGHIATKGHKIYNVRVANEEMHIKLLAVNNPASASIFPSLPEGWGPASIIAGLKVGLNIDALADFLINMSSISILLQIERKWAKVSKLRMNLTAKDGIAFCAIQADGDWPEEFRPLVFCGADEPTQFDNLKLTLILWPTIPEFFDKEVLR